jgi:hypothetical protein
MPKKNNEDDIKKNHLFLIPLKFRVKPFLGLAQLSKISFIYFCFIFLSLSQKISFAFYINLFEDLLLDDQLYGQVFTFLLSLYFFKYKTSIVAPD